MTTQTPVEHVTSSAKRRVSRTRQREIKYGLLFVSPAILFFSVFYLYPLGRALFISFHKWSILKTPRYIGTGNYLRLFSDPQFYQSLKVTFYYTFGTVVPIWILALLMALLFNQGFRGRKAYLTLYYLPAVITLTVWSLIFRLMYHPSGGLLTIFTKALGFDFVRWLNDPDLAMPALILLSIWKGAPFYMIIYLAGLRSIPLDYYEAAMLDGAGKLRRFWHITLPLLQPVILFVMVYSIIVAFQVFTPAFILTNGGPGAATRVMPLFIVQNAFSYQKMGYASAASFVLLAILMGLTLVQFKLSRSQSV